MRRRPTPRDESLVRTQRVAAPLEEAFAFFADPRNLGAITPPWLGFRLVEAPARLEQGSVLRYRLSLHGVPIRWRTEITEWSLPRSFVDEQVAGPYRLWVHAHRLRAVEGGTEIHDHVRYRTPVARRLVRRWLEEIFDFRTARMRELLGEPPR
ncbi:MAG TPA: SRPBCC family protein [Gaiellaceae bacterium]|nr:SRPBCC family protein [Gaiellaceae bacterium]